MKIVDRIINRMFKSSKIQTKVQEKFESRRQEQVFPEFANATGMSIDPDDDQFRRLTQTTRDQDPLTHERSVNISYFMHARNGFYKRLIEISLQAIASAGIKIETEDEIIQDAWFEFWEKPGMGMSDWFYEDMVDVTLSGEANWPLAVNPVNGDLEVGYVDPLNVKAIKMLPGNVRVPDKLLMKDKMLTEPESGRVFEILKNFGGFLAGDLIHFPINKPRNASRGVPAFIALLDQVDMYDQLFFNEGERMIMKKSFIWDVTIKGAKEDQLRKWMQANFPGGQPPKPASVRAHNEEEEWKEVTPSLDSSDSSEAIRTIREGTAGAGGYPSHWFGWGGDTNVATAREMTKPTIWMIEWQQRAIVRFLTKLFSFQLQTWNQVKHLESGLVKSEGVKWEIKANNVFPREFVIQAEAFGRVVDSIAGAKASGLVGDKTARKMFVNVANEADFNLNLSEVEEEFEGEENEKDQFGSKIVKKPELSDISFNEIMRMSKKTVRDNGNK